MQLLEQIADSLEIGDFQKVHELTQNAINNGLSPKQILDGGLIAGMNAVGEKFRKHEIFLPNVLLAAKAMYAGMDILKPLFLENEIPSIGKIVIGTVQGDLHDIGKNLVGIMLRGAGFEVIDLGKDVSPEVFVETAQKESAELIGMSALLTTTQPVMRVVVDLLKEKNLHGSIRTVIGGAPVSEEFADEIGADAFAYDAASAVETMKSMLGAD